jgi:hypothetical protein
MRLFDHSVKNTGVACIVLLCTPLFAGWQAVDLQQYLVSMRKQERVRSEDEKERMHKLLEKYPNLSAYKIFEKATAADMALTSKRVDSQTWLQSPQAHLKTSYTTYIHKIDNIEKNGSVSQSTLERNGMSRSQWMQTYETQGIEFNWDIEARAWKQEEVNIPDGDSKVQLAYGLMRNLYSVEEGSVDISTVDILGVEKHQGRDCFVLQFDVDQSILKKYDAIGRITQRLWIDCETFLRQMVRAEGSFNDLYILQISQYSMFNALPPLSLPGSIVKETGQERVKLQDKIPPITREVAEIRGWPPLEKVSVEFIDRPTLRAYLIRDYEEQFTQEETDSYGLILKWLGLLDKEADYKSVAINSGVSGIAGLYNPKRKTVFIGDWIPPFVAEAVIAHEIAHAYQDKDVGLDAFIRAAYKTGSLDEGSAHSALTEGEATAVMLEYLLKGQDQGFKDLEDIFVLIEQKLFPEDSRSDKGLTYNLYGWGTNFVQSYLKEHAWADLSAVYRDPPSAMKQIIHPYKYPIKEKLKDIQPSGIASRLGMGWQNVYRTRIGEFFIMLSLRQYFDKKTVLACTRRYKQDDTAIYRDPDGRQLLVYVSQWDSAEAADKFLRLYRESLAKKYPKNSLEEQKDYAILSTDDAQIFISSCAGDQVQVAWTQAGNNAELHNLARSIIGQLNSEI